MSRTDGHESLDDLLRSAMKGAHPPMPEQESELEDLVMKSINKHEIQTALSGRADTAKTRKAAWLSLSVGLVALLSLLLLKPFIENGALPYFDESAGLLLLSGCVVAIAYQLSSLLSLRLGDRKIPQSA